MPLSKDLLHPTPEEEKRSHKLKRLVQSPNSYFMDVKCPGCYKVSYRVINYIASLTGDALRSSPVRLFGTEYMHTYIYLNALISGKGLFDFSSF